MRRTRRTALGSMLLVALAPGCGAVEAGHVPSQPDSAEVAGSLAQLGSPDPMASSPEVPADPPPTLPHYPPDLTPEEIAELEAEEARIDALEAARPPDTGPLYELNLYLHPTETIQEAVGLADLVVTGVVTGVEWGAWRETAVWPERDRFLLVEVEQALKSDDEVAAGTTIRLRQTGEVVVRGVLRERREGEGAVHLREGDRALLLLLLDAATGAYGKLNLDGVQRLHDGEVEQSQRTTTLSREVEQLTEAELLRRVEAAVRLQRETD